MTISVLRSTLFALSVLVFVTAQEASYQPCPILGPRYPKPTALLQSETMRYALLNLTQALNQLSTTGTSDYTATSPNTTSFSVALFAADDVANSSQPFFYEYHHTAPSFEDENNEIKEVDADSAYNIAGLSHVFVVYGFLIAVGEQHWMDPVSQHIPLIVNNSYNPLHTTSWDDITLLDLATYLAGIPREDVLDSLVNVDIPSGLVSILPRAQPAPVNTIAIDKEQFLEVMTARKPVYLPGTTPIYSDASFQMLALAIESITGKSYNETLTDAILNSLNMSSTSIGTPPSTQNAVIPVNMATSGWSTAPVEDSFLAATSIFSSIHDLSLLGRAILSSTLLTSSTTNRWLKPHAHTSNLVNDVGAPWTIYKPTLTVDPTGAVTPIYTKLGARGLYSAYFGLAPDYNVGFAVLSADTAAPADLNAHVDVISQLLIPALERTAMEQAARAFAGSYSGLSGMASNMTLTVVVDGRAGLAVTNWTARNGEVDVRAAYAVLRKLPPDTLDFRLYPTNLEAMEGSGMRRTAFRAVVQDVAAPVDAGTPTCTTWFDGGVDTLVWNGEALDEFVFEVDEGDGLAVGVELPAFGVRLSRD